MIKIRLNGKDVTIKKVTVTLNENIRDILLKYFKSREIRSIITAIKYAIKNKEFVIAEIDGEIFEFMLFADGTPRFVKGYIDAIIWNRIDGVSIPDEAKEDVPLMYSLKEVPETSNEETGDTSQDEAGAETSET